MADERDILEAQTDYPAYRKRRKAEIAAAWGKGGVGPPVAEVEGGGAIPAADDPVIEDAAAPAPKRRK